MRYPTSQCVNCENNYRNESKFCPHCGQQTREKLTVSLLFYNTITNYFSADARFFKSIVPLLFRPGHLSNSFVNGRRSLYLHPAQLYLFLSVLFFFLMTTLVVRDNIKLIDSVIKDSAFLNSPKVLDSLIMESDFTQIEEKKITSGISEFENSLDSIEEKKDKFLPVNGFKFKKLDSLIASGGTDTDILKQMGLNEDTGEFNKKMYSQFIKLYRERSGGELIRTIFDTFPVAMFVLLPIFAFLLKLFFYRQGTYTIHLVFSFYFFSFLFFIFILMLLTNHFLMIPFWIDFLIIFAMEIYLILAIKKCYKSSWFSSVFRSGVITIIYFLFVIPIAFVMVSAYGFWIY